ncbi:MAG: 23S rRNA (uracil(1939)-C(5))-methyltransferase RlmD [Firmicutes bacterium]|nr:23S rRNA (uracil(1939)-C(5))-methyltransferase RlmD [Bacillota bacterium]
MAKKFIQELYIDHLRYPSKGIAFLDAEKLDKNGKNDENSNLTSATNCESLEILEEFQAKTEKSQAEKPCKIEVNNTLPGQIVTAECTRKKKKFVGRVISVNKPAPQEIPASCPSFGVCGGCTFLNIPYEYELELKKQNVLRLLKNLGNVNSANGAEIYDFSKVEIVPSPNVEGYRNKMEFSFGDAANFKIAENAETAEKQNFSLSLGIRNRNRNYEVTQPKNCVLVNQDFMDIVAATLKIFSQTSETFYHRMRHTGNLRYLVVRRGEFTDEILVNLVTTSKIENSNLQNWLAELLRLPLKAKIVGILHTASDSVADAVIPENTSLLHGQNFFTEKICELNFDISPFAFFQTNSSGAELLYNTVTEFVNLSTVENVNPAIYDLYCGTGTITQCLSKRAKNAENLGNLGNSPKIIGVDIVAESIEMAKQNAIKNNLTNCKFITADVLQFLEEKLQNINLENAGDISDFSKSIAVVDPPRDGIHPKALTRLLALNIPTIIYISCKPTSLARDLLAFFDVDYKITNLRLHDMFPRTPHIETVCLLQK